MPRVVPALDIDTLAMVREAPAAGGHLGHRLEVRKVVGCDVGGGGSRGTARSWTVVACAELVRGADSNTGEVCRKNLNR